LIEVRYIEVPLYARLHDNLSATFTLWSLVSVQTQAVVAISSKVWSANTAVTGTRKIVARILRYKDTCDSKTRLSKNS